MRGLGWITVVGALALCGCKPNRTPAAQDPAEAARAVSAAETAIRADIPNARMARFRGVQSYEQALPGHRAVCGQVSPYPDDQALFVPFVAVMTRDGRGTWSSPAETRFVGTTVSDADRTYMAIVAHCYDKGGPSDSPLQSVAPLPPAPNQIPRPAPPAPTASASGTTGPKENAGPTDGAPGTPSGSIPAGGSVSMRQNANLHASPRGASVRVVPQGTALHVFATAPGGWYQVGDDAPWGWVHESMLDGAGR